MVYRKVWQEVTLWGNLKVLKGKLLLWKSKKSAETQEPRRQKACYEHARGFANILDIYKQNAQWNICLLQVTFFYDVFTDGLLFV